MPQIFQVLRCYKCQTFQVHHVKQSNKWACKMCNEKQSIKRHYGIGTGLECRVHVQKLNGIRGGINDDQDDQSLNGSVESDTSDKPNYCYNGKQKECITKCEDEIMYLEKESPNKNDYYNNKKQSKWNNYIDEEEESDTKDKDETMYLENIEVVLEVPKKKPRKKHNTHDSNEYLPDISNRDNSNVSFINNKTSFRKYENNSKLAHSKIFLQDSTLNNASNDIHNDDPVECYTSEDKPNCYNNGPQSKWNNSLKNAKECFIKCENKTMYLENSIVGAKKSNYYNSKKQSKWNDYIDEEEECVTKDKDETMYLENIEVVLEVPKKIHRKNNDTHESNEYIPKITNCDNNFDSTNSKLKFNNIQLKNKQRSTHRLHKDDNTCRNSLKEQIDEQQAATVSTSKIMFSLCEDGDIDDILSI